MVQCERGIKDYFSVSVFRGCGDSVDDLGRGHVADDLLRHAAHALRLHLARPLARAHRKGQNVRRALEAHVLEGHGRPCRDLGRRRLHFDWKDGSSKILLTLKCLLKLWSWSSLEKGESLACQITSPFKNKLCCFEEIFKFDLKNNLAYSWIGKLSDSSLSKERHALILLLYYSRSQS